MGDMKDAILDKLNDAVTIAGAAKDKADKAYDLADETAD